MRAMKADKVGRSMARVKIVNKLHFIISQGRDNWFDIFEQCPTIDHWLSGEVDLNYVFTKKKNFLGVIFYTKHFIKLNNLINL